MCHTSVIAWAAASIGPDLVTGRTVCEVGSYDVNGSVRAGIEAHGPTSYLGVDIEAGAGVDLVANVEDLPGLYPDGFGLVVSTEMLEHVDSWKAAIRALVLLVAPGGALVVSTRSLGFPYHPYPQDTWRYSVAEMDRVLLDARLDVSHVETDPEQAGVFAVAHKPATWTEPRGDWWPDMRLPIWDGTTPEDQ
jgi:SAM-dependent methyltransferase